MCLYLKRQSIRSWTSIWIVCELDKGIEWYWKKVSSLWTFSTQTFLFEFFLSVSLKSFDSFLHWCIGWSSGSDWNVTRWLDWIRNWFEPVSSTMDSLLSMNYSLVKYWAYLLFGSLNSFACNPMHLTLSKIYWVHLLPKSLKGRWQ